MPIFGVVGAELEALLSHAASRFSTIQVISSSEVIFLLVRSFFIYLAEILQALNTLKKS